MPEQGRLTYQLLATAINEGEEQLQSFFTAEAFRVLCQLLAQHR